MKLPADTRYSLIEKIKNPRDAEAWHEFASIYQPLIFKICCSRGMQHADATDVTQDVLARIAQAIEQFRYDQSGATFRGWLYRITRNMVADFFRKGKKDLLQHADRTTELRFDKDPARDECREFQIEFQRQVFTVVARQVQNQVKPQTWAAFWETEMENRHVESVASELEMTPGAIYVARSRVIARLRKEVQKRLSETDQFFVHDESMP